MYTYTDSQLASIHVYKHTYINIDDCASGVMVIVVENGYSERVQIMDEIAFYIELISLRNV